MKHIASYFRFRSQLFQRIVFNFCFSGDDDGYDGPSSVEAEANSSDCGFDDLDMGDIPEPSYPLSNPRRNSLDGDMQVGTI